MLEVHHHLPRPAASPGHSQAAASGTGHQPRRRCGVVDRSGQLVPYSEAWEQQKQAVTAVEASQSPGLLLLQQHPPVYTLGAGSSLAHLRFDPQRPPHPLFRTERGGEVTYHGPGQLVLYPVLNLRRFRPDLHWFLRSLEEVVIRALDTVSGLRGERIAGLTGVWVRGRKVAALGVRARRWVTYHGLALNVATDLTPFGDIVPCGLADKQVTSVDELLAEAGQSAVHLDATVGRESLGVESGRSEEQWAGGLGQPVSEGMCVSRPEPDAHAGQQQRQALVQEYAFALLEAFAEVFAVDLQQVSLQEALSRTPGER